MKNIVVLFVFGALVWSCDMSNQESLDVEPSSSATRLHRWTGKLAFRDRPPEQVGVFEGATCVEALVACIEHFRTAQAVGFCFAKDHVVFADVVTGPAPSATDLALPVCSQVDSRDDLGG